MICVVNSFKPPDSCKRRIGHVLTWCGVASLCFVRAARPPSVLCDKRGKKYFGEGFLLFLWAKKRFVPEERKNSFYSGKKGEKKAKKGWLSKRDHGHAHDDGQWWQSIGFVRNGATCGTDEHSRVKQCFISYRQLFSSFSIVIICKKYIFIVLI